VVRALSDRLLHAQRGIRILDALNWGPEIERAFFAAGTRKLPPVSLDTYRARPLGFDPEEKQQELQALQGDIQRVLGPGHPAGRILLRLCAESRQIVELLRERGTARFALLSRALYGSASERCHPQGPTLTEVAAKLSSLCDEQVSSRAESDEPSLDAGQAARLLHHRLAAFFGPARSIHVSLSEALAADAAAVGSGLRIRTSSWFSPRQVRMLEVHEGWVHLGTTFNGQAQPICTFLNRNTPSSTVTQEGLAVLTEVLARACYPARVQRLAHRVEAIARVEAGADFLDVYRFFLDQGQTPGSSYQQTMRIFRGSLPAGCGPFTKDLSYCKGLFQLLDFLHRVESREQPGPLSLLFCGKTCLGDVEALASLADEGLLAPPRYLPPPFAVLSRPARLRGLPRLF
jgi:uncharacterized protein (TIGR02421 family)